MGTWLNGRLLNFGFLACKPHPVFVQGHLFQVKTQFRAVTLAVGSGLFSCPPLSGPNPRAALILGRQGNTPEVRLK